VDDEAAMERMRAGDPAGLEHLYRRYFAAIFRFAGRQCGARPTAEDIAQDTFVRAFRYAPSHQPVAPVAPWLFRIAFRLCLDRGLQAGRCTPGLPPGADRAREDPRTAEAAEFQAAVSTALAALPPAQRAAFLLHRVHGLPIRGVAAILECPAGTVKSRVHHAARRLRPLLQAYLKGEGPCASRS